MTANAKPNADEVWHALDAAVVCARLDTTHEGLSTAQAAARNALLLLMVLFENVQIGHCRSETKAALRLSPLRSPLLLAAACTAFLVHVAAMYLPVGQRMLGTEPVGPRTWITLAAVAVGVFLVIEVHKLTRTFLRRPRRAGKR